MERKLTKAEKKDKRNRELCALVKQNDLQAQTQLILENEGLIVQLAKSLEIQHDLDLNRYAGIEMDDLLQEGRLAILEAARKFNPAINIKFSSYAYMVIGNRIRDLCRKGDASFERQLADDLRTQVFLDDNPFDEDGIAVSEKVQDGRIHNPAGDEAVVHVMIQKMYNRMELLSPREHKVLVYHYLVAESDFDNFSETAEYFHSTEKLIRKTEGKAFEKLLEGMNDKMIL